MANDALFNAKKQQNDEFNISSSWKLLSFRLDDGKAIYNKETSELIEGGAF